jgi:predicted Rossmann fold flavoprotein
VRDRLIGHAARQRVNIVTDTLVTGLHRSPDGWIVERQNGDPIRADAVILATGGLSVPHTGSDGRGLLFAEQLGHTISPTYPALTPLLRPQSDTSSFAELSGISLPVSITARSPLRSAESSGGFLFTHQGYSGPAVLDISHVAVRSRAEDHAAAVTVRWSARTDAEWEQALRPQGTRTIAAAIGDTLPHRLAVALLVLAGVAPDRPLSQLTRAERLRTIEMLVRAPLPWADHEGYKKAEVTGGGVRLDEIDPRTMESRIHRGLFLSGEMLDAFGPIGGYNFLWAWATGRAAGIGATQ